MDDYVSKPIRPRELFETLDRVVVAHPAKDPVETPTPEVQEIKAPEPAEETAEAAFDLAGALERMGGDEDLLREMAGYALEDTAQLLEEVRQAVEDRDAEALATCAHSLKSTVGNFGAQAAFEAALKVEMMGRSGDLSGVEAAYTELEGVVQGLRDALLRWVDKETV